MASIGFWIITAACAIGYLATPLERGKTFVRKSFPAATNKKTRGKK
jgi:hypothetical protein